MLHTRNPFHFLRYPQIEMKGWNMILHSNGIQKKAVVAIFISYKIDF
jgi:hypothetical protein